MMYLKHIGENQLKKAYSTNPRAYVRQMSQSPYVVINEDTRLCQIHDIMVLVSRQNDTISVELDYKHELSFDATTEPDKMLAGFGLEDEDGVFYATCYGVNGDASFVDELTEEEIFVNGVLEDVPERDYQGPEEDDYAIERRIL